MHTYIHIIYQYYCNFLPVPLSFAINSCNITSAYISFFLYHLFFYLIYSQKFKCLIHILVVILSTTYFTVYINSFLLIFILTFIKPHFVHFSIKTFQNLFISSTIIQYVVIINSLQNQVLVNTQNLIHTNYTSNTAKKKHFFYSFIIF